MLIFVISSCYPNHVNPQANIFVHEQCVALEKAGCKVVVLDATSFRWKYWFDKSCYKNQITEKENIIIYSRHIPSFLTNKLFRLSTMQVRGVVKKLFARAVKDYGIPDVIYAHFTYPSGYVSCELSTIYNIPLIVLEHGGFYMKPKISKYQKKILLKTTKEAELFACVSEAQRECLYKHLEKNKEIKIINNMIEDRFRYYPLTDKEDFVFFSAGNLYKVKRMDMLINAFVKEFSPDESVILKIAGEGAERETLEKLIKKNNREHQVQLLGRLNRDEMLQEYIECNAFVLVSEHESFGIAYREAMAVGRPVISSDNGGISSGWKDDYGEIVPLDDIQLLMQALRDMYENYSCYDFKRISDDCIKNYSSRSVVNNVINEIQRVICGDKG